MSSASVEPKVESLTALLEDLASGRLRVPRFQRAFVWTGDRVVKLLQSVKRRYPIGSLLVWRSGPGYACFDHVGPHRVPVSSERPHEVGYLLDGHQRLSSLFGTLVKPEGRLVGQEQRPFAVFYDLDREDFLRGDPKELWHIPLWVLMDPVTMMDRIQALMPQGEANTADARELWERRTKHLKQLASTFQTYRIAVNEVKNADLGTAVNVFTLLNSTGVKVDAAEMFAALSWSEQGAFDFAGTTQRIRGQLTAFADLDAKTVLRALLARLGEDIYTTGFSGVVERHGPELPEAARGVERTIGEALDFMRREWGVASVKSLPYALQIVLVSEYMRLAHEPSAAQRDELLRALWLTSYTGAYTVGSAKAFNDAIGLVRRFATGELPDLSPLCEGRVRAFPTRFHPKAARVRVFFLFLKALKPRDLRNGEELPWDRLLERGLYDALPVVNSDDDHVRRLANRLLLGRYKGDVKAELRALFEGPSELREPILRSHAISDDALLHLIEGDDEGFLRERERRLIEAEQRFIQERLHAEPSQAVEAEPEIDIDLDEADEVPY